MSRLDRLALFRVLKKNLKNYSNEEIENAISQYYLSSIKKLNNRNNTKQTKAISQILKNFNFPADLEYIIEFFEFLLDDNTKSENGIVFTPKFIANYIFNSLLEKEPWNNSKKIIDPGCGGGIFLVSAIEILYEKYNVDVDFLIENCIYGFDIEEDNVRRCSIILKLLSAKYGGNFNKISSNIRCKDSLKINWCKEFNVSGFSYIIGNPPYINPHDLNSNTIKFIKSTFKTTKYGIFNVFYAFIEHAIINLSNDGNLGYIVPNNFLTIKSALNLRDFLKDNKLIYKIIDFADNMLFRPTRTYSCIVFLNKAENTFLDYHVMSKSDDIENNLNNINFNKIDINQLDSHGWKLVDEKTRVNLSKIESHAVSIKSFIRTGIATLKDAVFMVDLDENGFYKIIDKEKKYIEEDLVKPIYKISDLKLFKNIKDAEKYIIFPYKKSTQGYTLIDEEEFKNSYPLTYEILLVHKELLNSRDKGRPNPQGWYAYGRTQGLNKYGKKLLFPTFSNKPKFTYVNNENALFCNGYGIFENERYSLNLLEKILNSSIMDYYVSNTSYSIEGGYYCYQKKYIERFSIPWLTDSQILEINSLSGKKFDNYLWKLYELN